jgi:hypothetical protein
MTRLTAKEAIWLASDPKLTEDEMAAIIERVPGTDVMRAVVAFIACQERAARLAGEPIGRPFRIREVVDAIAVAKRMGDVLPGGGAA